MQHILATIEMVPHSFEQEQGQKLTKRVGDEGMPDSAAGHWVYGVELPICLRSVMAVIREQRADAMEVSPGP